MAQSATTRVIELLKRFMKGGISSTALRKSDIYEKSKSTFYRDLQVLKEAGLVEKREGDVYYLAQRPVNDSSADSPFQKEPLQVNEELLALCQRSLRFHNRLYITYISPRYDGELPFKLAPIELCAINNRLYLVALDQVDGQVKEFRLDRIQSIQFMPDIVQPQIDQLYHTIRFRIKGELINHYEPAFREFRKSRLLDGRIEYEAKIHSLFRAKRLLISYGPDLEVIEPLELRNDIKQWLADLRNLYKEE